jgi:hypothetical protein
MTAQNYKNHRRLLPLFHGVLFLMIVLGVIGAGVNLYQSWGDHQRLYSASLIVVIMVSLLMLFYYCRTFALKAQDRAIRAEENLRHFAMTGKLLNPALSMRQTIALRFASDAEFVHLAERSAKDRLEPNAIKQAIQNWRADTYRA